MAKKKQEKEEKKVNLDGVVGLVGSTTEQAVSETLEVNYTSVFLLLHLSCCSFLLSVIRLSFGNKVINMCRQQRRSRFFFFSTVVDTV